MRRLNRLNLCACVASMLGGSALAQMARALPSRTLPAATQPVTGPLVAMDFPADGVELSVLADLVSQRLHIPILYDDSIHAKKVIVRVPLKVPESALMGILQSALRIKQMALVEAEGKGWMQIVAAPSLAGVAKAGGDKTAGGASEGGAIAQVFVLNHADPTHIAETLRPFITQPNGYLQADAAKRFLIVSDYPSIVQRVDQLVKLLDADAPPAEVRFVPLKESEASQLAPALSQLIANRETAQWGTGAASGIFISADERTNQLVVIAPPSRLQELLDLIDGMDKAASLKTRVYRLKTISPDRLDRLARGLLGPLVVKRGYQSVVDRESASLAVSATPDVFTQLDDLVKELDVPVPDAQSPIRFYKLKNTKAADVLATLSGLLSSDNSDNKDSDAEANAPGSNGQPPAGGAPSSGAGAAAAGQQPAPANGAPATTFGGFNSGQSGQPNSESTASLRPGALGASAGGAGGGNSSDIHYNSPALPYTNSGPGAGGAMTTAVKGRNATVAADLNTNSIIVVAPPLVQQTYADLIKRLDERRPQVQIECTIVTLDTANGFSFGVDIGKLGASSTNQFLTLSSFGISTANPATGQLAPNNSTGGTFALLSPRIANIVLTALQTNSHSRFLSAPQLLVNDNGKGKLESVAQEPFAVILDASSTQSLTSLGGQAQAGTSISVEPHISEADYLQLGYSIELSNFTGAAANGLPPPSQKNSIDSSVTIPDGYTIVVGGLTTKSFNTAVNTIPILGDIPVFKYLFGTRSRNTDDTTLFVFIKPTILRDDKFEDLKYLSSRSTGEAGLPGDYPQAQPIPMR